MFRGVMVLAVTAVLTGAIAPAALADEYELRVGKSPADVAGTVAATATTTVTNKLGTTVKTTPIIECGEDCEETVSTYVPCLPFGCDAAWPVVSFEAKPGEGFRLTGWEGCEVPRRGEGCLVDPARVEKGVKVIASFEDVQPPAVQPMGPDPGATVTGNTTLAAGAADNWGVAQVEFLTDGRSLGVDSDPRDGWTFDFDTGAVPEGIVPLRVLATDLAGLQAAADWSVVVDRSASAAIDRATPSGFLRSAPPVRFSLPADAAAASCRTLRTGAAAPGFVPCGSPYVPSTSGDGAYTVEVAVTDTVGNLGVARHAFTLDTTAPAAAITGGPADGEVLARPDGAFAFTVADASPLDVECGLGGALAPCGGTAAFAGLGEGSHRFVLRIEDAAGNVTELARGFSVDLPDTPKTDDPKVEEPKIEEPKVDPPTVLRAIMFYSFAAPRPGSTKLLALRLTQLPAGGRLDIRCTGRGCPARRSSKQIARAGKLALKAFAGRRFAKGTTIEIRLTKPGAVGTLWRLTIVPRKPPRFERRCLDAAGGGVIRCPAA